MMKRQSIAPLSPAAARRRWFFQQCGVGLAGIAAQALLARDAPAAPAGVNPLAPRTPHFAGRAKRVLYLFHAGAPSH